MKKDYITNHIFLADFINPIEQHTSQHLILFLVFQNLYYLECVHPSKSFMTII